MTKKFGGSRAAVIGSALGLIAGMIFFPPLGLLIGSFLGAFAGELINARVKGAKPGSADNAKAFKAALGAFVASILGADAKLIVGAVMIYYAVKAVVK